MEDLTIKQLSEKKKELDKGIQDLINTFTKETGLSFKGVNTIERSIKVPPWKLISVSTEWDMDRLLF